MSTIVERPELSSFNQAWKTKAPTQAAEELASYSLETKRIPDPYYFLLDRDGDLFSPSAQVKVKTIITTNTKVGRLEAQAFESISKWARENETGVIAWLSPPEPEIYPVSKIIISEIEQANGAKKLLNRAIVLDIDKDECLSLGQRLSGYSTNRPFLTHLDQLRSTPLLLDNNRRWIEIMEEVIPDAILWDSVKRGEEILAKQQALQDAERIFGHGYTDDRQMQQDVKKMLGEKAGSCPVRFTLAYGSQTAFQIFSSHVWEADERGSLYFPCPHNCGKFNKRLRGQTIDYCGEGQEGGCGRDVRC